MNPIALWCAVARFVLVDYWRLRRMERHSANGYGLSWDRLQRTKRREPKSADALPCVR